MNQITFQIRRKSQKWKYQQHQILFYIFGLPGYSENPTRSVLSFGTETEIRRRVKHVKHSETPKNEIQQHQCHSASLYSRDIARIWKFRGEFRSWDVDPEARVIHVKHCKNTKNEIQQLDLLLCISVLPGYLKIPGRVPELRRKSGSAAVIDAAADSLAGRTPRRSRSWIRNPHMTARLARLV